MKNIDIEIKRLDYLYANLSSALFGIPLLALILSIFFYESVDQNVLIVWFILNLFFTFIRYLVYTMYQKVQITSQNLSQYYWYFFASAITVALLWGSVPLILMPESVEYRALLLVFIFAIMATGTVSLSSRVEILYSYLFITFTPFLYTLVFTEELQSKALTLTLFLSLLVIASVAKKLSKQTQENIEMVYENISLVEQLKEKVQEANVANEAKSNFLSVMSHEIRTPLNAIVGFVSVLKRKEEDPTKLKYLNTIDSSSKILTNVINDILDITKIESGNFALEKRSFEPSKEFNTIFHLFEESAKQKNITFINSISKDLPKYFKGDVLRLNQILSNLLSNALKFTNKDKSIELAISYESESSLLNVQVRDEGIGIEEKDIEKITQPFTQADSSTARKYGGTGLGLSIVTNLLKLFDSELKVQSTIGKGSTFSFSIHVEVPQTAKEKSKENPANINLDRKCFLVAEDNKTNQMLIKILLTELGATVKIAEDGLKAEDIFNKEEFDMIFMDINMPRKNGIDAMLSIKESTKYKHKPIPIVALTANATSGDEEKYISLGFDSYLSKPIENHKLILLLSSICEKS